MRTKRRLKGIRKKSRNTTRITLKLISTTNKETNIKKMKEHNKNKKAKEEENQEIQQRKRQR